MATKFEVETKEIPERAILVGVDMGNVTWPLQESLDELERLVNTAGACVVGRITQHLTSPNARTFIGPGKAEELSQLAKSLEADLVVFDDELTPSQQSNLEHLVGKPVKVIDRTALILDIFALHATTKEGRLQVKLAQNQYLYPRLRGMWSHLASNRMGGGVGSRFGEGESQLEVDRRLVRKRISRIQKELADLSRTRSLQRKNRSESGIMRIALAGYTNAGKSSLLNSLTNENVLAYDKLFATLDSTTRKLELPNGHLVTLTDTVGFIQKLPHSLVEAFHSTLEEIHEADLILLVVDASSSQKEAHIAAVQEVLNEIDASNIPTIVVYNKIDAIDNLDYLKSNHPEDFFVSAHTKDGIDKLLEELQKRSMEQSVLMELIIPYDQGRLVQIAHEKAHIENETYENDGTHITLRVPKQLENQFKAYCVKSS